MNDEINIILFEREFNIKRIPKDKRDLNFIEKNIEGMKPAEIIEYLDSFADVKDVDLNIYIFTKNRPVLFELCYDAGECSMLSCVESCLGYVATKKIFIFDKKNKFYEI